MNDIQEASSDSKDITTESTSEADGALDLTVTEYDETGEKMLNKLRSGLDINYNSLKDKGVILEPEVEDGHFKQEEDELMDGYFMGDPQVSQKIQDVNLNLNEDWDVIRDQLTFLTEDRGVGKKIIRTGCKGEVYPGARAHVTIHYHLLLEHEVEPFDSTVLRGSSERFKLDEGQLIPGLEILIRTMRRGEAAVALLEPLYAYRSGCPPRIPPDSTIQAYVELLHFSDESMADSLLSIDPEDRASKDFSEIMTAVGIEHRNGNRSIQSHEFKAAVRHYEKGISLLKGFPVPGDAPSLLRDQQEEVMVKLLLNLAHASLQLTWPKKASHAASSVLAIDGDNAKAYYRLGRARRMLTDRDGAKTALLKALKLQPGNTDISREICEIDIELEKEKAADRLLASKMFSTYTKVEMPLSEEVSNSVFYSFLRSFCEDDQLQEVRVPGRFQDLTILKKAAASLKLEVIVKIEENTRDKVVIVKKRKA